VQSVAYEPRHCIFESRSELITTRAYSILPMPRYLEEAPLDGLKTVH